MVCENVQVLMTLSMETQSRLEFDCSRKITRFENSALFINCSLGKSSYALLQSNGNQNEQFATLVFAKIADTMKVQAC